MKDEDKTKAELIKELKLLREERGKEAFKDFAEHKQVEEALKESEEKYRNLIESVNESVISVDLQGSLLTLNSRAVSYLGGLEENYIGKTLWDIFPKKIAEERFAELQKVIQSGEQFIKESYLPFQGKTRCFLNSMQPIKNRSGDIYAVLILASDITEQKQAEEKLKDSEEYLKILFDYAPDAYYINDLKGSFIDGNRAAERLIGYKREELIGKSFLKLKLLSAKDMPKATKSLAKSILGLPTGPEEYVLNRKDKSTVAVELSNYPVKIKGKTYILGIARDITERKLAEDELQQSYQKTKRAMDATIETMSKILEAKDPYTAGHQQRVSQLATAIAKELNFSEDKIEGIRIASLIHDIGKIGLPTEILSKPIKLTDIEFIEFSLIKEHPQIGYNILKSIDFSYPVAQIVLQHHERLNGSGYPNHLKGDEIILEARIIGVADVVVAMSSHRPYRPALGIDKALEEISKNKGTLYDPKAVEACLKLFKEKEFKFE